MKSLKQMSFLILSITTLCQGVPDDLPESECNESLQKLSRSVGRTRFIPSGVDPERIPTYLEDIEIIFGKGGVAEKLGYALPNHTLEEVPPRELALFATLGRHALRSWVDGANIVTQAARSAGVMEFVTPGQTICPTCRSFYSASVTEEHQRSIMMHVAGHNDFFQHSIFTLSRGSDPIAESLVLKKLVDQFYLTENPVEVSLFLQYLETLDDLQDYARGTFQHPDAFRPEVQKVRSTYDRQKVPEVGPPQKNPIVSSPNVLQAAVENLSPHSAIWKRIILKHYERMKRVSTGIVPTKIMNEGWATLSMEILAGHSPWTDSHHEIEFANLLGGVAGVVRLDNPYWLGRECWRIQRRRFESRPENQGLDPLTRDQRFVEYAHRLIEEMDDYRFIRDSLDEQWVHDHELYLHRPAREEEVDPSLPIPPELQNKPIKQYVVTTREAKPVIDHIARNLADHRLHFPRIFVEDFNGGGSGAVHLRHEVAFNTPLKRKSAAQALYVLSQIFERPVSILTVKSSSWTRSSGPKLDIRFRDPFSRRSPEQIEISPVRIEVAPNGNVQVFDCEQKENGQVMSEKANLELTEDLQKAVDFYKEDIAIGFSDDAPNSKLSQMVSRTVDSNTSSAMGLISHIPTAGDAILEYSQMLSRRLIRMVKLAASGKRKIDITPEKTVRLRALPLIPTFELDKATYEKLQDQNAKSPLENLGVAHLELRRDTAQVEGGLGNGRRRSRERFWGPKEGEGEGRGEGEEEGDTDEEGDLPSRKRGNGPPVDPTIVEVPLDVFHELLDLELPNRKQRESADDRRDPAWEEIQQFPDGNIQFEEMMPTVISRGIYMSRKRGRKPTKQEVLREGTRGLTPADNIVSDFELLPFPDSKAVLVQIMDMSGSMHGRPQEILKQFYYRLKILLLKKYKTLEVIHIGFNDHVAKVFDEETFYKTFLSGGDRYILGWKKGLEVLSDPKFKNFDKYGMLAGDFQSAGGQDVENAMKEFLGVLNYGAVIQTVLYGDVGLPDLTEPVKALAKTDPWFDYGQLTDTPESLYEILQHFFGKNKKPK